MVKWVIVAVLLMPLVEFGVFALVAARIGLLWALGLTLATSAAGFAVLSAAGRGQLVRLRRAAAESDLAAFQAMAGGLAMVLGGLLLLIPGFVTDLIGVLVLLGLLGPVRRWSAAVFRRAGGTGRGGRQEREPVVDLAPEEWTQVPQPRLERRPGPDAEPAEPPAEPKKPD